MSDFNNKMSDNCKSNICNEITEQVVIPANENISPETSITSSLFRFRDDFDDIKCKMLIFGESLNLCKCMAEDYQAKLTAMERRLQVLEKKGRMLRRESNYSAIIQKNKKLSEKIYHAAKKLQMCGSEDEMREVAAKICRNYLHGVWKTVETTELDFRRISGGLSNFLYYVALPDYMQKFRTFLSVRESSPEDDGLDRPASTAKSVRSNSLAENEPGKVLLRIYGQVHGERAMDAIVTESVIFTLLSERRLGPKLHGVFSGGRIEEYIPGRALLTKELSEPALSMKIAEKMAAIHCMDVPLSKEPTWLWKTMGKWLKIVVDERLAPNAEAGKTPEEEQILKRLKIVDYEKEIEWLKKFLNTVESPVVFCHNDMQEGNILLLEDIVSNTTDDEINTEFIQTQSFAAQTSKDTNSAVPKKSINIDQFVESNTSDSLLSHLSDNGDPKLVLIDFEYCAYNYRGFDLANHFQEWVFDYSNSDHPFYFEYQEQTPTLEQKEIFIRQYLKHYHGNSSDDKSNDVTPSIDEVNHLLAEVEAFALASHLFWTLWSIVNASKSQIPFGYWEYAQARTETYLRLKQEVIKKEKYGIPQKRKICEVDI